MSFRIDVLKEVRLEPRWQSKRLVTFRFLFRPLPNSSTTISVGIKHGALSDEG